MKNNQRFLVVIGFLAAVLGQLSANAQKLVDQGRIRPTDAELYVRSAIAGGGGDVNLLAGRSVAVVGELNFDGNRLDGNRNFVADAVTINYGVAATGTNPSAVAYTTALPAALTNANIVARQDGKVLFSLPISGINQAKNSDERYRTLGGLQLIKEQHEVQLTIEFPAGADLAPGADNSGYIEVLLRGFETYIR